MKQVQGALSQHLAQPVTTLARVLQITRQDGEILGFTDHDADLSFPAESITGTWTPLVGPQAFGFGGPWFVETGLPFASTSGNVSGILSVTGGTFASNSFGSFSEQSGNLAPLGSQDMTFTAVVSCGYEGSYVNGNMKIGLANGTGWTTGYDSAIGFLWSGGPGSAPQWQIYSRQYKNDNSAVVAYLPPTNAGIYAYNTTVTLSFTVSTAGTVVFFINGVQVGTVSGMVFDGTYFVDHGAQIQFEGIGYSSGNNLLNFTSLTWEVGSQNTGMPFGTFLSNTGLTFSAIDAKDDGSPTNTEVTGFVDDTSGTGISEADVRARFYDNATFQLSAVNWNDLTMGSMKLLSGTVGDIKMENGKYTMQLRGLTQYLTTTIGSVYGPTCRATLFGGGTTLIGGQPIDPTNHWKCGLNQAEWVQGGTVGSSSDSLTIVPSGALLQIGPPYSGTDPAPAGWFSDGLITFTSGELAGYAFEIATWDGTTLSLFAGAPMPFTPNPGDTFIIEPGCSKLKVDCLNKFHNIVNFQAEAEIPGLNVLAATSQTQVPTT